MIPIKLYRNEWKYQCGDADLSKIEGKLNGVIARDRHGEDGVYYIHSLYFDDVFDTCASDTEAGLTSRFKYRIRYYGDNADFLRLEKKEKLDGRCHKKSCVITGDEYDRILNGDLDELLWSTDKPVLKEFCINSMMGLFRPKAIIDYERTAYVDPVTNERITFDRNISVSGAIDEFLTGDYLRYPILPRNQHVLEVKYDYILTSTLRHLVSDEGLTQSSFSKYYLGRKRLGLAER